MRVNARQTPVSHAALAHADSTACDELRAELERHVREGGATVLVTPIVDPLIIDSASFGFPAGDDDDDGAPGGSLARNVDFDGTVNDPSFGGGGASSRRGAKVLVEGTVCKCDPDDPGDCCARGLATYCTSCPVLASCDDAADASELEADCGARGGGSGSGGRGEAGKVESAFARAIMAAAATHTHRHLYYAAIVQTSHGVGVNATTDGDGDDEDDGTVVDGVGYEEFLVHRPAGDAWIGGALPPPTSVRRASFGPHLRGELRRLVVQQSAAGW